MPSWPGLNRSVIRVRRNSFGKCSTRNPQANARKVRDAWTEAGHEGSISQTLVNKQRSELGLAGNLKGGRPPKEAASAVAEKPPYTGKKRGRKPKSAYANGHQTGGNGVPLEATRKTGGGRQAQLSEFEAEIDRLLFRIMVLGGLEDIEESLRRTRRLVYQAATTGRS